MMNRRQFGVLGVAMGVSVAAFGALAGEDRVEAVLGDDGMYHQTWFLNSFLDLSDDLTEAAGEGKRLAIMWEQKGCPYCKETHLVNLARPEINKFVRENFAVLQLNIWGSREVTDFDGMKTLNYFDI